MTGVKTVKWIVERIVAKTGRWIEGKIGVRIGNLIGAKIVKLTDRWIAVKIDNRIELRRWTARIGQTDLIDQSDPDTTNSCGKTRLKKGDRRHKVGRLSHLNDWSPAMAKHILETMFSSSATVPAQLSTDMPAAMIPSERRREARKHYGRMCSYEMVDSIGEESVVIRQGEVFALNRSKEGMLILMGQALQKKQLIEVHSLRSESDQTVNVFEARWAKPVPVESFGNRYLIGCQRIFGPLSPSIVRQAGD